MHNLKILFVVPYVPSRIRVRPYHLIRTLAARGHRVTLLTAWATEEERRELEELREECFRIVAGHLPRWRSWANCLRALPTRLPLQAAYSWHPGLARQAKALAQDADITHVEHLRGSLYALCIRDALCRMEGATPIVWDSVDCISLLFEQAARFAPGVARAVIARLELGRTRWYERLLVRSFARTLATSAIDADALRSLAGSEGRPVPVTVLPNGVDLDHFRPDHARKRQATTLVMTGKMSYHANIVMAVGFVRDVLPLIRDRVPEVSLWVVGKDPPAEVRALGGVPGVTVTGTVPDLRPYLQQAGLAVAPVAYGAGIQNKVLEAMACATPVVASPLAMSALEAVDGRDLVVADTPEAWANAVVHLVSDEAKSRAVGSAGRAYVESHHSWAAIVTQLEESYHEVIRSRV